MIALAACAFACAACSVETYVPTGPAWVELGTGVDDFVPISVGGEVELITGVQGGSMIPLSLRAGGVVADDARVRYQVFLADTDTSLGLATRERALDPVDADTVALVGTWLMFDASLDRAAYVGRDLRIELELVDADGARATDTGICRVAPR